MQGNFREVWLKSLKYKSSRSCSALLKSRNFFISVVASFARNLPNCAKALSPVSKLMSFKVTIFWMRFLTFFFSKSWLFVAITFRQIASELWTTMDIRGLRSENLKNTSAFLLRFKTCSWLTFPHFKRFCNSLSAANPRWTFFVSTRFFSFYANFTNAEVWASLMTLGLTINPSKDTTSSLTLLQR